MKKHAIIPVFIPHKGCPNDCVFCNQRKITARTDDVTADDVSRILDTWLVTLDPVKELGTVEAAFYGGSFTGLTIIEQNEFLDVAQDYKKRNLIDKIHLSTRPDYIDREILDNLREHDVDTIERGVQSFDDEVLRRSNRGHTAADVYRAADLIKEYGFELGIQLMIGLPGDSMESCLMSARRTAEIGPQLARLYPTIVLDETELLEMYKRGDYQALTRDEAVERTKEMYKILDAAGITIMRVGLKSTDIIGEGGAVNGGTYHPAFRQLVEGEIAKERIEEKIKLLPGITGECSMIRTADRYDDPGVRPGARNDNMTLFSNNKWFSAMVGHKACNKRYFAERYPDVRISYKTDDELADGEFKVCLSQDQ